MRGQASNGAIKVAALCERKWKTSPVERRKLFCVVVKNPD